MKKVLSILSTNFLYCFFLSCLIITSCNTKEEGCLDIRATNFAFDADKSCDDCCSYPRLYIKLTHLWDDTTAFRQNQIYPRIGIDTFKVIDLDYAFSHFMMTDVAGTTAPVEELLDIWCNENGTLSEKLITDDVIVINLTNLTFSIGTFRSDEQMSSGSMTIGLPDSYDCAEADSLNSTEPLSATSVLYHPDDLVRVFGRLVIQKDTAVNVLDTFYLPNLGTQFNFDLNKAFKTGKPDTIFSLIQYQQWFQGINLRNDQNQTIINQMSNNIPSSIVIE